MGKTINIRKVAIDTHIDVQHVKDYEQAGILDAEINEMKEWCVLSIMLGVKENADKLIKFDIEPTSDGGINVCASLLVHKQ